MPPGLLIWTITALTFDSARRFSASERSWLLRTRPYLVRPQRFVLPMLPWTRRPAWQLRAGLALYDALALYRGVPHHRRLNSARAHELMPSLAEGATAAFTFFDARLLAPERLALELALAARAHGAFIANHAEVRAIAEHGGRVSGVEVELDGEQVTIESPVVINAAGPWVDAVLRATASGPGTDAAPLLGVTRGAHIVLELDEPLSHDAIFSTAKSDGRVFFAIPQGPLLLVGTTDDRYDGDPGDVRPTLADETYLLEEARQVLPGLELREDQVRYSYAGLRPLRHVRGGPEAAIGRGHDVIDHGKGGGPAGLFSVVGGKLSTFRPLASAVLKAANLPRARGEPLDAPLIWRDILLTSGLPRTSLQHLRIYGDAAGAILELGREIICTHCGAIDGEVLYTCRHEAARTLSDVLMRRTGIAWSACRALCCHREVAALAASELGWDRAETERQIEAFERDVNQHLPTPTLLR